MEGTFSLRKARQALVQSQFLCVFGEIRFDGYFWKLRKMDVYFTAKSALFQFGKHRFLHPVLCLGSAEMSSTGRAVLILKVDGCSVAPRASMSTAPSRTCLLSSRRPLEGSREH